MSTTVHPDPGTRCRAMMGAITAVSCLAVTACAATAPAVQPATRATGVSYPASPRSTQVDDYHGTRVADPYRWMEQFDSPAVKDWVAAQNGLAQPYLEGIPARDLIKQRLTRMWSYERFGTPVKEGGRYFWLRNDGTQDQSVLYVADRLDAEPRVLIDPNTFARDATIALADWVVSPDGRLVAYATSDGGTDWKTWRVRDVATGRDLQDVIRFTKFTRVSWDRDAGGFYYARYPEGATGQGDDQRQVSIHRHRLGEPQSADALIYSITDHPTRNPAGYVTDDGRYLVISVFDGYDANGLYYLELGRSGSQVIRLIDRWDGLYRFLGNRGSEFLVETTKGAARGRVVAIDLARPDPGEWRTVVPEQPETLDGASYVGGHVIARYLKDARALVRVYRPDGTLRGEVPLPGAGTVTGLDGHGDDAETFFAYADYLTPDSVYRYDVTAGQVSLFRKPQVAFDPSPYVTEQVFYASRDGTRVPMFITRRRDTRLDGASPTLLYGYGGFSVAITPEFRVWSATWLDMGGIYAVANLRGGNEYGEAWHEAGTKLQKQNVFDDFIAAADWLVANRYTSRNRLAIMGRSNGGLLVGAVITQRPDIAAAALPGVGVLDMLRYHTASANARQWSSDYGLSDDPAQFRALLEYSPVHNVREGTCYPATLVTTADHDDRVVPWHSFKFGAALQHAQGCANPVLLRIETRAGHGAGKPVWMQIEDWADQWAFLARHLGITMAQ